MVRSLLVIQQVLGKVNDFFSTDSLTLTTSFRKI